MEHNHNKSLRSQVSELPSGRLRPLQTVRLRAGREEAQRVCEQVGGRAVGRVSNRLSEWAGGPASKRARARERQEVQRRRPPHPPPPPGSSTRRRARGCVHPRCLPPALAPYARPGPRCAQGCGAAGGARAAEGLQQAVQGEGGGTHERVH